MKRERDSQRARFFKAVGVLDKHGTKLGDMQAVRAFIFGLYRATLQRRYGDAVDFKVWPVEIKDGRGYSRACASPSEGWVTYPRESRNTVEVIRTIAFIVAARICRFSDSRIGPRGNYIMIKWGDRRSEMKRRNSNDPLIAWYGVKYCAVLVDLVRYAIGEDAANDLKASFAAHGVKYAIRAKRVLTEEQKTVAAERGENLAKLRKDQLARERFSKQYPEAPIISKNEFGGDWEDIYRLWRP